MKKILIIGATSAIAHQTAINFAKSGWELHITARNIEKLEIIKKDILARHQTDIYTYEQDALDFDNHKKLFDKVLENAVDIDNVLIAYGTLPIQSEIQNNPYSIRKEFDINALSVMSYATLAAEYFEKKKSGQITVISSVAGDRGRMSNYIYGAAKSAVTAFTSGLRARMQKSGVNVLTVKPGFVDTPMTEEVDKNFLFANPKDVGKSIYDAIINEKDVLYVPGFWKIIMLLVKSVPESIFKKLKF